MGSSASTPSLSNMTPMLRQYYELKSQCPDYILFFRMGDFYEIFGDDAVEVSGLLNIVLTKRDKGEDSIPFCGVPHHSAKAYWLKLIKMNYKIAIADQTEDPSQTKGLLRRELTKFLTPACIDDWEGLASDKPNYLMFFYEDPEDKVCLLGLTDISTGDLKLGDLESIDELAKFVEIYRPKEILLRRFFFPILKEKLTHYLSLETLSFTPLPESILRDKAAQASLLQEIFGNVENIQVPVKNKSTAYALLASVFTHLRDLKFSLGHYLSVSPLQESERITLNNTAIQDLEIFATVRQNQQKGSLFNEINFCLTPMGSRFLRWTLNHPLLNQTSIEKSHDWVSQLISLGEGSLGKIRHLFEGICDIERLLVKLASGSIRPKELHAIKDSLRRLLSLPPYFERIQTTCPSNTECLHVFLKTDKIYNFLNSSIKEEVDHLGSGDGVFVPGFDTILDQKNDLSLTGEQKVQDYQEILKKSSGISSLKIKHHKNFGHLIEITKSHLSKAPSSWIRRQTMVNCERFITVELQELSDVLSSAKDDAVTREHQLYENFLNEMKAYLPLLKQVSQTIAEMDLHLSFAVLAMQKKYCRAEFSKHIELKAVRHPTVENFVGTHAFHPNDLFMDERSKCLLITGPNMGGKSTIMRTLAICAILNQSGAFVPALSAKLPLFDQIFTRVGASDDLAKGLSTFMVEMMETSTILRRASSRSLVILDEVGRGTSTEDGLAIASAILEELANKIKAWSLFATHYHELVEFAKDFKFVKTYQTEVIKIGNSIKFSHRLIEGASGCSYGVDVARLAGIPDPVVQRAHRLLSNKVTRKVSKVEVLEEKGFMQTPEQNRIISLLGELSLNQTTPIQALNLLVQMKDLLEAKSKRALFPDGQSLF